MDYCGECGEAFEHLRDKFCGECGSERELSLIYSDSGTICFCGRRGVANGAKAEQCQSCGSNLNGLDSRIEMPPNLDNAAQVTTSSPSSGKRLSGTFGQLFGGGSATKTARDKTRGKIILWKKDNGSNIGSSWGDKISARTTALGPSAAVAPRVVAARVGSPPSMQGTSSQVGWRKPRAESETEYIASGGTKMVLRELQSRKKLERELQSRTDASDCQMQFQLDGYEIVAKSSGKPDFVLFRVHVTVDHQTWSIFRRYSQLTNLKGFLKREGTLVEEGMRLLTGGPKGKYKFDNSFLEERSRQVDAFLQHLLEYRDLIFRFNGKGATEFIRLILPTTIRDKPQDFLFPFDLSALS